MTSERIFTPEPSLGSRAWLIVCLFLGVTGVACVLETGQGDVMFGLFGLPALLFGYSIGRGWAIAFPILLATAIFAVGIECSTSETPQALLLVGTALGVLARRTGEVLIGGHR